MTETVENVEPTVEELQAQLEAERAEKEATKRALLDQRKTVIDVTQKYARAHNLCSVVDQALTEAGILKPPIEKVLDIMVPLQVRIGLDPETIEHMSEEDVAEALSKIGTISGVTWALNNDSPLGSVVSVANGNRRTGLQQPATTQSGEIQVVGVGDVPPPPPPSVAGEPWTAALSLPESWVLRYTAPEGRKAHLLNAELLDMGRRGVSALCGADGGYRGWRETSSRREYVNTIHGICSSCRRISTNRLSFRVMVDGYS